jgi:hypothetical protein
MLGGRHPGRSTSWEVDILGGRHPGRSASWEVDILGGAPMLVRLRAGVVVSLLASLAAWGCGGDDEDVVIPK